jgi:hypothetical protein
MATLAAFFRRTDDTRQQPMAVAAPAAAWAGRDLFELRLLPHEALVFHRKPINNSRLVREADPKARGACWSAIGGGALAFGLLLGVLAPNLANTLAGYRMEELRAQERSLLEAKRSLELQEAELISPDQLERYAREQRLVAPAPDQVTRLEGKSEGAVAMVKK